MSMTTPYCEKHEWPGGMDRPCPDCAEIAALQAENAKLRAEVERLKGLTGIRAMEIQAKEMAALREEINDRASERDAALLQLEEAKKFHTNEYKDRVALQEKCEAMELQVEDLRRIGRDLAEGASNAAKERDTANERVEALQLQKDALLDGIQVALTALNSGGAYCPQDEARDAVCKALFDGLRKAGVMTDETAALKPVGQPQYFCNKCGYVGPVQYPHQRFKEVETEFCRYYGVEITNKNLSCGEPVPGGVCAFKRPCPDHGVEKRKHGSPVPSNATPDCGCLFDPKTGRQVAVGPGCADVRGAGSEDGII